MRINPSVGMTAWILGVALLAVGVAVGEDAVTEDAVAPIRMKGDYPANLIYGAGHLAEMGCPHDQRPGCFNVVGRYLHNMGLRSTRSSLSWFWCEFERGQEYDWTLIEDTIPAEHGLGFSTVALITDTPIWASHPKAREILEAQGEGRFVGCLSNEPETWPDYERWLRATVERYGQYIDYYEVRNEPDGMCGRFPKYWEGNVGGVGMGGDPVWYTELLKRTFVIIRELDPTAKVAVGGFERKSPDKTYFIEGIYENGGQGHFDAVCIHPYSEPYGDPFDREWMGAVRAVMEANGDGDKPFWITEYNNEGRNEMDMSFTVRRKHRLLRETPWTPIAIPLGTKYMYFGDKAANWPLRAIRQMEAEEFEARSEWVQDFEAPTAELLANWEWRAQSLGDPNWPEIQIMEEKGVGYTTGLWVEGKPSHQRIRVLFLPYVRSADPTFEVAFAVSSASPDSPVEVQVGMESLKMLEPTRISGVVDTVTGPHAFRTLTFRVADHWPDWVDAGVNMIWLEFTSAAPGFSIAVDDVRVH